MEFTFEQLEAIERRGEPVFVQAGAGSGKTRVLVERFVRAVTEDGVQVDRVLAITFTEKAAGELRARVRARLLELGRRDLAREAEAAWVSTIHGFCTRLLRTHALRAGLDPEFRVLDEAEAGRLAVDAFDKALERFLEVGSDADRLELVASYTPDRLEGMVRAVYARLRSRGRRAPELPEIPEPRESGERERLEYAAAAALRELDGVEGKRVGEAVAAIEAREGFSEKGAKALGGQACLDYLAALEDHDAIQSAKRAYAQYGLLRKLLAAYGERYEACKRERSGLDFDDLELIARDLLLGDEALRDSYRARFDHVLVDEFQDTNRLQAEIVDLVARAEENLFTVGDSRQSIYLFRNADIAVFEEARERARVAGGVVALTASFRARAEVLDAINLAFAGVFGDGVAALAPAPPAQEGAPVDSPSVELLVVDSGNRWRKPADEDPFGCRSLRIDQVWRAAEARLLAARVATLVRERRCKPGEVAVLLRALSDVDAFERALGDQGLPTYVVGGRGYWSQQQVTDLRAWLAALVNPCDELALYSVLASPLVGASLDALAVVGRRAKAARRDVWWALQSAFQPGEDGCGGLADVLAEDDRDRIRTFVSRFAAERARVPRVSLEALIDRAITLTGYDRAILALPAGERRMANVRKLMRLAREYEADEGRNLRGFLDFVDEQDLVQARQGEAPLEASGVEAVRLMTIHAAKGLEFPVVCVADLGRGGRGDDDALRVTDDGRVGLQLAALGEGSVPALEYERIKEEQRRLGEAEEKRVFYVGFTRAERHLIVSGATDLERLPDPRDLGIPMDWVHRALAPGGIEAALAAGGEAEWTGEHAGRAVSVRVVAVTPDTLDATLPAELRNPGADAPAAEVPELGPPPAFDEVEVLAPLPVSRLSYSGLERYRACGYRFYLERVLRLAADPARAATLEAEALPRPGEDEAAGEVPAILRGTVVHELLERLDFERPVVPSAEEVAAALDEHGAPPDAKAIETIRDLIGRFASSDLRARLAGAAASRRELPFAYTLAADAAGRSLLVNGVVDVLADEPDRALVVDYKSDALDGIDPVRLCEDRYSTQRLVYALAALRAGYQRVEVVYCFLERAGEPIGAVFEAADAGRLERELVEIASDLLAGRFVPTDSPHADLCRACVGQRTLCSHEPRITLAPRSGPEASVGSAS